MTTKFIKLRKQNIIEPLKSLKDAMKKGNQY
jgi:hypothetical protein